MHIKFIVMYIPKFMHDATCCAGESWGLLEASGPLAVQGLRRIRGLRPFGAKAGAWACRGTGDVWLPGPMAVCGGVEKRFTVSRNSAMRVAQRCAMRLRVPEAERTQATSGRLRTAKINDFDEYRFNEICHVYFFHTIPEYTRLLVEPPGEIFSLRLRKSY